MTEIREEHKELLRKITQTMAKRKFATNLDDAEKNMLAQNEQLMTDVYVALLEYQILLLEKQMKG